MSKARIHPYLLLFILLWSVSAGKHLQAQSISSIPATDSIKSSSIPQSLPRRISLMPAISTLSVIGGISHIRLDNRAYLTRHSFIPEFRYHYDDYLQFLPYALQIGMRARGYTGRSHSWQEMLAADAGGGLITAAAIFTVKHLVGRERPDGSARNSFPSGHTATAFLGAELFDLEYGHLYPRLSLLNYGAAAITGISRVLNNRHWASDVVVGAGVGICSAHLGYFISDALFGVHTSDGFSPFDDNGKWFAGLYNMQAIPLFLISTDQGLLNIQSGEVGISVGIRNHRNIYTGMAAIRPERYFTFGSVGNSAVGFTVDMLWGRRIAEVCKSSFNLLLGIGLTENTLKFRQQTGSPNIRCFYAPRTHITLEWSKPGSSNRSTTLMLRGSLEYNKTCVLDDLPLQHTRPTIEFGFSRRLYLF